MTAAESAAKARSEFAKAAMIGLCDHPRWLPSRFLYDDRGSRLFDAITTTPEYYPTRTESAILAAAATDIHDHTGPVTLVELGSGSSSKTGHLLSAYAEDRVPLRYVPVDVSASALRAGAAALTALIPGIRITPIHGTYDRVFPLLGGLSPAVLLFLGSTVGNLGQSDAARFWHTVVTSLAPGDFMLLGVDLVKDPAIINAAYNDAAGHSAEFTRNIFHRMNHELGAGLDLSQIDHVANYVPEWQRVEIFAQFRTEQFIHLEPLHSGMRICAGERIMTEISRKFVLDRVEEYLGAFGLATRRVYADERRWFAVLLLQKDRTESGPQHAEAA